MDYPTSIKKAIDICEILPIELPQLLALAESGYMPHYIINGELFFKTIEVKRWLADNVMGRCEGRALPAKLTVTIPAPPAEYFNVPSTIAHLKYLQEIPNIEYQPGVYFLCLANEVVYVGQSVSPASRISTHRRDNQKIFDRVYLLPIPETDLNDVEAMFIKALMPSQQGGLRSGKATPTVPTNNPLRVEEISEKFGFVVKPC